MTILPVGIGGAGHTVVDWFRNYAMRTGSRMANGIAVDVSESDFNSLNHIDDENHVYLDDSKYAGNPWSSMLTDGHNGEGLKGAVENIMSEDIDCFLVIGGLSGRLGSNAGVISGWFQSEYDLPVYGLGILPTQKEGNLSATFAATGLSILNENSDGVIIFDNAAWSKGKTVDRDYLNEEITGRIAPIFNAATAEQRTIPSPLSQNQLHNTLSAEGFATCGYHVMEIDANEPSLLSRFLDNSGVDRREQFATLVKKSALGRLTLATEISESKQVLIIINGPESVISDSHLNAAEVAFKQMMDANTNIETVNSGWYQDDIPYIRVFTVFSGVKSNPRIKELNKMAAQATETADNTTIEKGNRKPPQEKLTDRLTSTKTARWNQEYLLSLSPEKFEHLVAELYKVIGDDSRVTQASRDGGVDVIVEQRGGEKLVVQVKRYAEGNLVGKPTIQQTIGVREEHSADVAVVITSSSFSDPALELEKNSTGGVRLISGRELVSSLNESNINISDF